MDELRITLTCKKDFKYIYDIFTREEIQFSKGQRVKAIVRDYDGVRFEYKEKHYTLPCSISEICKYFECD